MERNIHVSKFVNHRNKSELDLKSCINFIISKFLLTKELEPVVETIFHKVAALLFHKMAALLFHKTVPLLFHKIIFLLFYKTVALLLYKMAALLLHKMAPLLALDAAYILTSTTRGFQLQNL